MRMNICKIATIQVYKIETIQAYNKILEERNQVQMS